MIPRCLGGCATEPPHGIMSNVKPVKAMTLRLSPEQAEELETIANIENLPVAEVVRAAITRHIEELRTDEGFRQGLRERIERAQKLLQEPEA